VSKNQPEALSQPDKHPVPVYTEEQVRQIVAQNLTSAMWNSPQADRLLKIFETYMGGVVHEKKLLAWTKPVIFIVILIAVGVLKHNGAFDGDVALLIGTITGYFFGRNKSNE
jgi:hypothetical protein